MWMSAGVGAGVVVALVVVSGAGRRVGRALGGWEAGWGIVADRRRPTAEARAATERTAARRRRLEDGPAGAPDDPRTEDSLR